MEHKPGDYEHPAVEQHYAVDFVKLYEESLVKPEARMELYIYPAGNNFLQSVGANKRVLDIGCGTGQWCQIAAQHGAKRVDGIDLSPDMAESAKRRNAEQKEVHICVGDATDLPFADNTFDAAISFFMICHLPSEQLYLKYFKELYRVLVPGGRAAIATVSDEGLGRVYLDHGTDQVSMEQQIDKAIATLPANPTIQQFNEVFRPYPEIEWSCFMADKTGHLFRIKDYTKVPNCQPLWFRNCSQLTFQDNYFKESFTVECVKAAGLVLDRVENYYTEERRAAYNSTNPKIIETDTKIQHPPGLMYHVSKPI